MLLLLLLLLFGPMFILDWMKWSAAPINFWLCCCCWFLLLFFFSHSARRARDCKFKLCVFSLSLSLKSFLVWPNSRIDISWLSVHNLSIEKGCQSKVKSELKNEWSFECELCDAAASVSLMHFHTHFSRSHSLIHVHSFAPFSKAPYHALSLSLISI